MLDLSALDTLAERRLLIRLIALLTSFFTMQHCGRCAGSAFFFVGPKMDQEL